MNNLEEKLHAWKGRLNEKINITLTLTHGKQDIFFEEFCHHLERVFPDITIKREIDRNRTLPEIRLTENLLYSALPLEMELDPFLEALTPLKDKEFKWPEALLEKLSKIEIPVRLKLYVAPSCPHCPAMVRTMVRLAYACESISLTIVDGTLFPEQASADGVMSAPCLVLNKDIQWIGNVDPMEVVDMILNQDPSNLSLSALKRILEQGRASWIAARIMEAGKISPAFIELLLHDTWSVRLGAMVVLEEITEKMPDLASRISEPLWQAFEGAGPTVKGDILYALGEAGDPAIESRLRKLVATLDDPELREAGAEALATLISRSQGCNKPLGLKQ